MPFAGAAEAEQRWVHIDAVDGDAGGQLVEIGLCHLAEQAGAIDARPARGGDFMRRAMSPSLVSSSRPRN